MAGMRSFLKRVLVRLVLVASVAPVILLGPSLVRAPVRLWHELAVQVAQAAPANGRASTTRGHGRAVRGPGRVRALRVIRVREGAVRVGWRRAHAGRFPLAGYRVWRDGAVVGQTRGRSFALRLGAAAVHVVAVAAVDTHGHLGPRASLAIGAHLPPRSAEKRASATAPHSSTAARAPSAPHPPAEHVPPTPPTMFAAEHVTDTSATLSWQAGAVTTGTLVGYMLYEDGEPEQVVHGQSVTLALASERHYTFTVRTLDSAGDLSEPAPELTVVTTHTPPSTPGGLTASDVTESSVTLSWSASTPVSGSIVGYRVFRDGLPVGEYSATSVELTNLAPSTTYSFTVVAADSLGAISEPTSAVEVRTADPTPTHGDVHAYLLATTDLSFDDLQAHYKQIGVVYPTYFECGVEGAVRGSDDPLVTGWARARAIAVMPRLNCQNPTDETQILTSTSVRETFIDNLASLCRQYGYNGIQIDFEGAPPADREPFTAFITALATRLHGMGDQLSTDVTAKTYNIKTGRAAMYDDAALSAVSDWVFVLDWGIHWTTSAPGPLDEMPWFKKVAEYTATMPNLSKFVLGMPMYGIDWKGAGGSANPGTALEYSEVMARAAEHGVTPEWDPVALDPWYKYTDSEGAEHTVWFTNRQSVQARVELARSLGLGVGLWHLGSEDQSIWSLPGLGGSG